MLALVVLAAVATAANAAPTEPKLPFLPEVYKNTSSFFNDSHNAAALARFQAVVGGGNAASLETQKDILRSISLAQQHVLPELRPDVLLAQAQMAARTQGYVLDRPSIADINKPIADYLYGGDVMVAPEELRKIASNAGVAGLQDTPDLSVPRDKRAAPVVTSNRWPKTQPIAYVFTSDMDETIRNLIRTATEKIAANTCLSFKENATVGSQLQFHRGGGCWSYIGNRYSGLQPISIDSGCGIIGIISHEISHALGLDHTQTRKDRDAYVTVNVGAVATNNQNNFLKHSDENDNFGVPYDFGSDMHYGAYDFSTNGQAVIVAHQADYVNTMGQRKYVTFNDYKMLNTLYKCSEQCPTQMVCQNGGYPSPKDCNACVCSDFYTGANCQTPKLTMNLAIAPATTIYHQDYDEALYKSNNNYVWDLFGKDPVKIIRAPEGKKIKVTIEKIYAAYGKLQCFMGCPFVGLEFVDNENGDLTTMGKIFCCSKDENTSFISKSNVIGYKAYASPGMPFDAQVSYTVV